MNAQPPTQPDAPAPEGSPASAAESRVEAPALVASVEGVARSRLQTVTASALLVEVAALLSSAQISVVVVCDAAGAAAGVITETTLVRRLGLGQADFFTTHAGERADERGFSAQAIDAIVANNKGRRVIDSDTGELKFEHADARGNTVVLNEAKGIITVFSPGYKGIFIPREAPRR